MRWPDLARLWLNATTACTHLPAECPAGSTGSLDRQNRSLWLRRDAGAVQGEARCSACSNSRAIPMDKSGPPPLTMPAVVAHHIAVPHGHYNEENMKVTVVHTRYANMLTIAFGVAASRVLDTVALAVHGGAHFIYPDCRPDFIRLFGEMQKRALDGVA